MRSISIFGLGYVGAVTAACLASRGQRVVGVDPNSMKVGRITSGRSPIVEAELDELIATPKSLDTFLQLIDRFDIVNLTGRSAFSSMSAC